MPQKKSSRTTSSKSTRKTSRKRTTRRTTKKPKVYIPAYKAIILCCSIITICMGLLLFTTLKESDRKLPDSVIERYKEEIVDSKKQKENQTKEEKKEKADIKAKSEKAETAKKSESPKKSETTKKAETAKKTETPKKTEPVKSEKTEATKKIETPQVKEEKKAEEPKQAPAVTVPAPAPASTKSKYNFPKAKNNAQLIFVFDDGGQNLNHLAPFLKLPFPITVAVLPQLTHSKEAAAQVRKAGFEVMLHQPMQAVNSSVNPGPGAIKPDMSEEQIKSLLFQNTTEIGPIAGMNNHEGSAITADAEKMAVVLQFCSQEGIYFLDSRTNVETKVPYVAGELGYSYYERNIFLDNEKTNENALKELKKGLDLANKNGSVIMIGQIWSADFLPACLQEV